MFRLFAAIFVVFVTLTALAAQEKARLADLQWMSGCWESKDRNLFLSEQWMKPSGGMMLGIGRTVKGERVVDFEFMRIEQRGDDIFFLAQPKENKQETPFKLLSSKANQAIFENKDHDFPQRVIYKRDGERLTGRIEGNNKGKFMGIDFPMTRAKCD